MVKVRVTQDHGPHRAGQLLSLRQSKALEAIQNGWAELVHTRETAVVDARETR